MVSFCVTLAGPAYSGSSRLAKEWFPFVSPLRVQPTLDQVGRLNSGSNTLLLLF